VTTRVSLRRIGIVLGVILGIPAALVGAIALVLHIFETPLDPGDATPTARGTFIKNGDGAFDLDVVRAGRPAFVNFWTTTCGACIEETPALIKLAQRYPNVAFVGLASFSAEHEARALSDKLGITYPTAYVDERTFFSWRAGLWPTTYLLDAKGNIVETIVGAQTEAVYAELIESHLL